MRRTLGQQRRRVALLTVPLAAVFTVVTAADGLWILAVPGLVFFVFQLVVLIRASRRPRPAPAPPPAERPAAPPVVTSAPPSPGGARAGRRPSPRDRAAARRRGRGR